MSEDAIKRRRAVNCRELLVLKQLREQAIVSQVILTQLSLPPDHEGVQQVRQDALNALERAQDEIASIEMVLSMVYPP